MSSIARRLLSSKIWITGSLVCLLQAIGLQTASSQPVGVGSFASQQPSGGGSRPAGGGGVPGAASASGGSQKRGVNGIGGGGAKGGRRFMYRNPQLPPGGSNFTSPSINQRLTDDQRAELRRRYMERKRARAAASVGNTTQTARMRDETSTTTKTTSGTVSQNVSTSKSASAKPLEPNDVREVLQSLSPEDRQVAADYMQSLDAEQRQALRQTFARVPIDARAKRLLDMARSGKKPETMDELRRRVGMVVEPQRPPLTIAARNPQEGHYAAHAISAANARLASVGSRAPQLSLVSADGKTVFDAAALRGKPLVLLFGSVTSPLYRSNIQEWNRVAAANAGKANFLLVYTLEAHPKGTASPYSDKEWVPQKNLEEGRMEAQPTSIEDRAKNGSVASGKLGEKLPIALDTMENSTWKAFGARPNMAFLIDADGKVRVAQEYADAAEMEKALQAL